MQHALLFAHPRPVSFTGAVAEAYTKAAKALGHTVVTRDLYRIGFNPVLKASELPWSESKSLEPDVAAERALLQDCDVFVLVYPFWLNAPPAMMKGYLERVFGFGFAYGGGGHSYEPLLSGRRLISFSSSGAPLPWLKKTGAFDAECALFGNYIAELCGMTQLDHIHVGGIVPGASECFVRARLEDVHQTVLKHFAKAI